MRGVLFGIAITLYCMCARLWYSKLPNSREKRKRTLFVFGYSSFIMISTLISFATDTHLVVMAFLDEHATSLQAPLHHIHLPTHSPALAFLHGISPPVIIALICLMQIWRVWIVWTTSRYRIPAILAPVLIFLASLSICLVTDYYALIHYDATAHPTARRLGISSVALLTSFNILISLLIMGRLIFVRRRISQLIGDAPEKRYYANIVSILVQSYALAAVCYLADTIARVLGEVGSFPGILIWAIEGFVEVIAYFLVWYRILKGCPWTRETELQLRTVRCNLSEELQGDNFESNQPKQTLQSSTNNFIEISRVDP